MAAMRTRLVLVAALLFLFIEGSAMAAAGMTAEMSSVERRQEVQSLLTRLNKTPLATIEVDIYWRHLSVS